MVSRRRWDVPAGSRFSHAAQGLAACQETIPEMKIVIGGSFAASTIRDEYPNWTWT